MPLQRPLRSIGVPQIPQKNHRCAIIRCCRQQLGGVVGIPRNGTDALPVVVEGQRRLLGLQIPDGDKASRSACGQNMRDLPVPCNAFDIVGSGGGIAKAQWILDVICVVDVEFALVAGGRDDLGLDRVELKGLDRTSMLRRAGYLDVGLAGNELLGIP